MMINPRVLLVEDDDRLRATVARGLRDADFAVDPVANGHSVIERLDRGHDYEVIILDVGLGDSDGRDVCQALRSRGVLTPVLFLTARGQVSDQLSAFAAGGDDFLAKPFHLEVLLARLNALCRRIVPLAVTGIDRRLHLDPRSHALVLEEIEVQLTPTEYRIMGCLLASVAAVVRRRELINAAWPAGAAVSDNTLDQYVTRLRRKLREVGGHVHVITVHGVGYRLGSDEA